MLSCEWEAVIRFTGVPDPDLYRGLDRAKRAGGLGTEFVEQRFRLLEVRCVEAFLEKVGNPPYLAIRQPEPE